LSLTDKVIKNTFYYIFSQIVAFLFPLFLTPFIISKIGDVQFGIYAIVLGFVGSFGLFDLSMSTSFIKFISEFYNKKDYKRLLHTINTGFIFYLAFSLIIFIIVYLFSENLLSLLNIPNELRDLSIYALKISLITFFVSNTFNIFPSILISLQKMYLTSILTTIIGLINFILIIILLYSGFGLISLMYSQLVTVVISSVVTLILVKKSLPELKFNLKFFNSESLKYMGKFGMQMQVSKLATFASEKYDEFLLGFFSVMNNVTYFNIGNRIVRFGKFFPSQFITQVAPVAAELNAKEETEKLEKLFYDTSKYLIIITAPIYIYIFAFADILIEAWMGKGYEIASYIVRILIFGQLINMAFSAPGNSITPNIGKPRYQMMEGLIHLGINLIISFFLIKYYGVLGAAIGNTIATLIASSYVFIVSVKLFNRKYSNILFDIHLKPILYSVFFCAVIYLGVKYQGLVHYEGERILSLIIIIISGVIFALLYLIWMFKSKYLNERDKDIIKRIFDKFLFLKKANK
jgi:O-antigen/teichoic acid export membrane protein